MKKTLKHIIYLVSLCGLLGSAFYFVPQDPVIFILRSPGLAAQLLMAAPKRCEDLHRYLSKGSIQTRAKFYKEILPLVRLTPEVLKQQSRQFNPWRYAIRLTLKQGVPEITDINTCMQSLISRVDSQSENLVEILLQRFGGIEKLRYASGGTWYGALVDACRNHASCAKAVAKKYSTAQNPAEREEWLVLLSQLNQYGAGEVIPIFENLPGLSLSITSTKSEVNEQADQMAKVVLQKLLTTEDEYNKYLKDKNRPLGARWRVALAKAELHNSTDLPVELAREALASPQMGFSDRLELLKNFSSLTKTLPEYPTELTHLAEAILKTISVESPDNLKLITEFTVTLRNSKVTTWAQPPVADLASLKTRLSLAVSEFLLYLDRHPTPGQSEFNDLALASRDHPLISQPIAAVSTFLRSKTTMDKGFALLSSGEALSAAAFMSLADAAVHVEGADRTALMNRLIENPSSSEGSRELLAATFPFMNEAEQKAARQALAKSTDRFVATLSRLANRPDLSLPTQLAFVAALSRFNFKDAKSSTYVFELNRRFTCTPDWIYASHALTILGPKTPGFEAAVFKLLSCPAELVDTRFLKAALLDKQARRRIQDFLNASGKSMATERQLTRLTEILGYANRVPGSTLPPKIKRETQGASPISTDH